MRIRRHDNRINSSAVDIRRDVRNLLDQCEVFQPPTPIEAVLDYRRLTTHERDLRDARRIIPLRFKRILARLSGRLHGMLDVGAKHIYVDTSLHRHRRHFLHFHEIAHDVLSWHRDLFVVTPAWALRPDVRGRFEAEANYFAAQSIFQVDDMAKWQRGKRLNLRDLPALAARYGASLNATARQYIGIQDLPAALLLGKALTIDGRLRVRFYDAMANEKFIQQFGLDILGVEFEAGEANAAAAAAVPGTVVESETVLVDLRGDTRRVALATLHNGYDTFTFLHPRAQSPLSIFSRVPKLANRRSDTVRR